MFRTNPITYQNKLQFVEQVTRKTFLWSIKALCKSDNFDQQISLDAGGGDPHRSTPYPIGNTFNLLYRDWMADKLDNRQPSQEQTQIFNHLLALRPYCNVDLDARALAACLARDPEFLEFFRDPAKRSPDFEFEYRT